MAAFFQLHTLTEQCNLTAELGIDLAVKQRVTEIKEVQQRGRRADTVVIESTLVALVTPLQQ